MGGQFTPILMQQAEPQLPEITMQTMTKVTRTFPSAKIDSSTGGLAVEVSLIAQLMHGSGNHLFASVSARQKQHQEFVDELDEPSAKLGGTNFDKGDPTSLYSFVVGPKGHPFHRHAGHRVFTAVSGSGGAQLRFSSASMAQIEEDPHNFIRALQYINIPPDCMFTVRFGGDTWHQFAPLAKNPIHPVFFALSCHTNELGGALPDELKQKVLANEATIPSLTTLLPQAVITLLEDATSQSRVATIDLSLDAPPGTLQRAMCGGVRGAAGSVLGAWGSSRGFVSRKASRSRVIELAHSPEGSLLREQLDDAAFHHEDTFSLTMDLADFDQSTATSLLAAVLDGFLSSPPPQRHAHDGVSQSDGAPAGPAYLIARLPGLVAAVARQEQSVRQPLSGPAPGNRRAQQPRASGTRR